MNFTPGPWQAHINAAEHRAVVRQGMTPIAEMWMVGQPFAERAANARLIAAAPELLEALTEAADELEAWGAYASEYFQKKHDLAGAVAKFRAAIAKATGETP